VAQAVRVLPISSIDEIREPELLARAGKAFRSDSLLLLARISDEEAGFVVLEWYPSRQVAFIYEVYVLKEFRRLGVGSALVVQAAAFAKNASYPVVWLRPRPLEAEIDDEWLSAWYVRLGFYWPPDSRDHMEKDLAAA